VKFLLVTVEATTYTWDIQEFVCVEKRDRPKGASALCQQSMCDQLDFA
jgi:hypothetical protein